MTVIVVFGVHVSNMLGMEKWLKQPNAARILQRHGVELRSKKPKNGSAGGNGSKPAAARIRARPLTLTDAFSLLLQNAPALRAAWRSG